MTTVVAASENTASIEPHIIAKVLGQPVVELPHDLYIVSRASRRARSVSLLQ